MPVALIDVAPTLLVAAGGAEEAAGLHGIPLLATTASGGSSGAAMVDSVSQRPILVEIGYARAVIHGTWKLVVINDFIDRCRDAVDGSCRNLHSELINVYQCNFTANGHMGNRLNVGVEGKFSNDKVHRATCTHAPFRSPSSHPADPTLSPSSPHPQPIFTPPSPHHHPTLTPSAPHLHPIRTSSSPHPHPTFTPSSPQLHTSPSHLHHISITSPSHLHHISRWEWLVGAI